MEAARRRYIAANSKSVVGAVTLAILFGPIGALYGAPAAAGILILVTLGTGFAALIVTWPLAIFLAVRGAMKSRTKARATADLVQGS